MDRATMTWLPAVLPPVFTTFHGLKAERNVWLPEFINAPT